MTFTGDLTAMADWNIKLHDTIIKTFSIREGQTISIGRGKECAIVIDNTAISRQHISLSMTNGIYFLSDLGSTNGSFVDGKRIRTDEAISGDESILFGKFSLSLADPMAANHQVATSISTDTMNLDDETIFVSGKKQAPPAQPPFRGKAAGPRLTAIRGDATPRELSLAGTSSVKIGNDPSCDLVISGWFVARAQAYLIKRDNAYLLVPQRSWAGTYVNDCKVKSEQVLRPGDLITIRNTTLRFD